MSHLEHFKVELEYPNSFAISFCFNFGLMDLFPINQAIISSKC